MRSIKIFGSTLVLLLLVCGLTHAKEGIIVNLKSADNPWADSRLADKLDLRLSTISKVPIIRADKDVNLPGPLETAHLDDLLEFGRAHNGRFLVDIFINRIDLKKRQAVIIPHAMSRFQVYGYAVGTIRIIDIKKQRLAKMVDLDCSMKIKDRWQLYDIDPDDPDLNISPDRKVILFDELEDKVAEKIFKEIEKLSRGNHFGD